MFIGTHYMLIILFLPTRLHFFSIFFFFFGRIYLYFCCLHYPFSIVFYHSSKFPSLMQRKRYYFQVCEKNLASNMFKTIFFQLVIENIIYVSRAWPSTMPIRQFSKAPKWMWGPKILEKKGQQGKKKWFQMNLKNSAHPFNQKTKFLLYPVKHWQHKKFLLV